MIKLESVNCPLCQESQGRVVAGGLDFEYRTTDQEFNFIECARCQIWYLSPRPAPEEIERIYPPAYEPYNFDKLPRLIRWARIRTQRERVGLIRQYVNAAAKIIDIGCGNGELLKLLRRYGEKDWQLVANDVAEVSLDNLRGQGIELRPGRFEEINLDPQSCDAILMLQVLEHLSDPLSVLMTAQKVLKPGGVIVIETPSSDSADARIFRRRWWGGYHFPRHWTIFNERTIAQAMGKCGLKVIKVAYLPSPAFWVQSIHHRLSESRYFKRSARYFTLRNFLAVALATLIDVLLGKIMPTSNMRIIGKRLK